MKNPRASIIVPTYNSETNLKKFFDSCLTSTNKDFETIINDDKRTSDKTLELVERYQAKGLDITYIQENTSMAQGRKRGAELARAKILIHLDSDMEMTPPLIEECIKKLEKGKLDALVIPEQSYGQGFWANCKAMEKQCYQGIGQIESLRCLRKDIYNAAGGHDAAMVFSEDKDLDLRIRQAGYSIGRTHAYVRHNEGSITLRKTVKKKKIYSQTANLFAQAHPKEYRWQTNILNRFVIYFKNYHLFFVHPLTYVGMITIKTAEFTAAGSAIIKTKLSQG